MYKKPLILIADDLAEGVYADSGADQEPVDFPDLPAEPTYPTDPTDPLDPTDPTEPALPVVGSTPETGGDETGGDETGGEIVGEIGGVTADVADCWSGEAVSTQRWNGSHNVFEVHITHSTAVQHISNACTVKLHFSGNVTDAYSENDWVCLASGTDVTVTRINHANAYGSGDQVSFKVWVSTGEQFSTEALVCVGLEFDCDKSVNVQGLGGDGS